MQLEWQRCYFFERFLKERTCQMKISMIFIPQIWLSSPVSVKLMQNALYGFWLVLECRLSNVPIFFFFLVILECMAYKNKSNLFTLEDVLNAAQCYIRFSSLVLWSTLIIWNKDIKSHWYLSLYKMHWKALKEERMNYEKTVWIKHWWYFHNI